MVILDPADVAAAPDAGSPPRQTRPFSTSFAQAAWDHDAYVLVQLEPEDVPLASIAAGGSDAYLCSYADAVVAFGHPVILSFGHEMNGN